MDYCFDTSAINCLHDDPEREAILSGLLGTNHVLVTVLNIREAVATDNPARRVSLLKLQSRLTNGFRPVRTPLDLLKEVTTAYLEKRGTVSLTIDESSQGLWWALQQPEEISKEIQQESFEWKKNLEAEFTSAHRRSRMNMNRIFAADDRPNSFGQLIHRFKQHPGLILKTVSGVYEKFGGAPLNVQSLHELFTFLPEWPLYMAGWAQGMYFRAIQQERFGPRTNAGTVDLWFAVYLAHCDFLVTDDRAQFKALRLINRIGARRRPRAHILLYNELRRRLIVPCVRETY